MKPNPKLTRAQESRDRHNQRRQQQAKPDFSRVVGGFGDPQKAGVQIMPQSPKSPAQAAMDREQFLRQAKYNRAVASGEQQPLFIGKGRPSTDTIVGPRGTGRGYELFTSGKYESTEDEQATYDYMDRNPSTLNPVNPDPTPEPMVIRSGDSNYLNPRNDIAPPGVEPQMAPNAPRRPRK